MSCKFDEDSPQGSSVGGQLRPAQALPGEGQHLVSREIECKTALFKQFVARFEPPDPQFCSRLLGWWRLPSFSFRVTSRLLSQQFRQICRKLRNKKSFKKNWSTVETEFMVAVLLSEHETIVAEQSDPEEARFERVASLLPGRRREDCYFRFLSLRKVSLKESPWLEKEDQLLAALVDDPQQTDWTQVGKELFRRAGGGVLRSGKQVREHYWCYLLPGLKRSRWSQHEDNTLIKLHQERGKRWYEMTKYLPGRNQNNIKNRFALLCKEDPSLAQGPEDLQDLRSQRVARDPPVLQRKISFQSEIPAVPQGGSQFSIECLLSEFRSFTVNLSEGGVTLLLGDTSLAPWLEQRWPLSSPVLRQVQALVPGKPPFSDQLKYQ